ncbi:hypothetical protein [Paenibacillus radicis (ex Xue et al. 2023)]|uniref:Uncharacterized protein n=1 Tax=Paenibacillus radicis (ex Xue et al. 2023) TaxID=2972489 RepID=A0ABT1YAP4_9BACL|nr:hypothetical protein [Paenibacillus radicis (ex Xue et al. 2023)]MCR8630264.1 hypothetical protein [Paenibacillus radicis (ex Xue et al. 2023)]
MIDFLCHYFDEATGPFRNLSDLEPAEAEQVLNEIRVQRKGFASNRSMDYLTIRRSLETKARELFILKGGKPIRRYPHYMTVGECPWLLEWFEKSKELRIPVALFDPDSISFTYGDLFPTMRYMDGKKYRGQVYTLNEINQVINEFGIPQEWNPQGNYGPERYIEVQVWDDEPLSAWLLK